MNGLVAHLLEGPTHGPTFLVNRGFVRFYGMHKQQHDYFYDSIPYSILYDLRSAVYTASFALKLF
jgi:hypothetical protein